MKRSFNELQIIAVLKEIESGITVAALCRKHDISETTYYKWKAKFGGMTLSDRERLEKLEKENENLKRLLAESILAITTLKDKKAKNMKHQTLA